MAKEAISVTLTRDNLIWLKGRADAAGCKSISELLDRLVTAARTRGQIAPVRSVVGTIEIDPSDPLLEGADARIRAFFEASLGSPLSSRVAAKRPRSRKRGAARHRA